MGRRQFDPAAAQMGLYWLHGDAQLGCTGGVTAVAAEPGAHCVLAVAHGGVQCGRMYGRNHELLLAKLCPCSGFSPLHR